jgi:hypothetical protein
MTRIPPYFRIFLLLLTGILPVQNTVWSQAEAVIKGLVVNEGGAPVKNASVKVGSNNTRTNSSGTFLVKNAEFPAQLTVSQPLYSDYVDMIFLPERWKDTIRVYVVMTGKENELDEVTVSAEQVFWVYPRKQANVLDFLLQPDNGIMLCCSDEHKYFIRSLNANGEQVFETPIRRHPRKLYRDCMQTTHLIYFDSIYETALVNNTLGIFQPQALDAYNLLQTVVYKDSRNLVRYGYSKQDQCIEYTIIDLKTKRVKTLYVGEDRSRYRELQEYRKESLGPPDELAKVNSPEQLKKARFHWQSQHFYEKAIIRPVYVPLFELNDSLIIFDHVNDSAVVFTKSGFKIRSFPIAYHYYKGWKYELITNLEKTKIYARYQSSDGLTTLREINPLNGKTEQVIKLEKHVFPQHIQIHENFVYYIYKDYLDQSMHYIYKQHLE